MDFSKFPLLFQLIIGAFGFILSSITLVVLFLLELLGINL